MPRSIEEGRRGAQPSAWMCTPLIARRRTRACLSRTCEHPCRYSPAGGLPTGGPRTILAGAGGAGAGAHLDADESRDAHLHRYRCLVTKTHSVPLAVQPGVVERVQRGPELGRIARVQAGGPGLVELDDDAVEEAFTTVVQLDLDGQRLSEDGIGIDVGILGQETRL